MEMLVLVLFAAGVLLVSPVLAVAALARAARLQRDLSELQKAVDRLGERLERSRVVTPPAAPAPAPLTAPAAATAPRPTEPVTTAAAPRPPDARTAPEPPVPPSYEWLRPPAQPPAPLSPHPAAPPSGPSAPDFATNLGPRILVATGALAFIVFLGLFVKYAWENDWVGPTGRVLLGALASLATLAGGLRLLGREYRPLGQGLAGAGLAGLYVSAFGAHGFYDLIPREAAGVLMAAITVNAVLLAVRLDARLLAGLAWVGGYLTPLLLSTGEDKALALFLYLLLLDLGALALDHRKPWPETVPLAMLGTFILYAGWYGQFFRPERFAVAAVGLVLFTALFALGAARKRRPGGLGVSLLAGALGVTVMATGADRPAWLLALSLVLAGAALRAAGAFGSAMAGVAAAAAALPLLAWSLNYYRPERLEVAALWVVGAALLFAVPGLAGAGAGALGSALAGFAVGAGAVASIAMAARTDRPVELMVLFLAQAGVAILARRRWPWSEVVGLTGAALSVLAWLDRYYRHDRLGDALVLTLPVAGAYFFSLVVRGMRSAATLAKPDALAHFGNATFVWTVLYRTLYASDPSALGLASVALAALYLALGLGALRARPWDLRQVRVELGLAAVFVTLAIPVQLGLNGITLAWALEGLLLVALGLRFGSGLARGGGYLVLWLAVLRLLARHLPARTVPFTPVLNPEFGVWLAVIAALGASAALLRRSPAPRPDAERLAVPAIAALALVLLFGVLTWETADVFDVQRRQALRAGDTPAAEQAALAGRLALSVLWTVFATGLLAGGLASRNRPLFYSAYALFAITAFKVVLVDLATLHTLYRMLSFLALALLLMAGAYLNLRFRERLLPREAAP